MAAFINHTAIYNRHCIVTQGKMPSRVHVNALKTSKRLIKLLSTYNNNNNSLHKLENKFYIQAGDQKLRYNLEWPDMLTPCVEC